MTGNIEAAKAEWARRQNIKAARAELIRRRSQAQPSQEALSRASQADARAEAMMNTDMSFAGRVKDNLIGVDDAIMSPGEKVATALNKGGESLTLGVVGDEAAALADSVVGRGSYDERLEKYRADERQFADENPVASLASEIAPAVIPGVGAAGAISKLGNVVGRTAAGALAGGTAAGIYGFAEGEGENRLANAKNSAIAGALLGAAAPKVTDFAKELPGRVRRIFTKSAERPSIGSLKAAKNAAYQAVDEAGEVFEGGKMTDLAARVRQEFANDNYVPETDNALTATLKLLDNRAGKPTTLTQLDKLRQNLWKRYAGAKDQPQILSAIKAIDDLIEESGESSALMGAARAANSRYAKSQLLDDAFRKAKDQTASTGSGGNILNKYRQAVTSIINNEKKARFFSPQEIEVMRSFVRGSNSENIKRLVGKLSPSGNGLMMALHVIGGVASNGASLPLMAVGAAAKGSAEKSAMRGASAIQDMLSGMPMRAPTNSVGAPLASAAAPVAEQIQGEVRNALFPAQLAPR